MFVPGSSDFENKKPKTLGASTSTSAMLLNSRFPGLTYNFCNQIGPPHEPTFEVTLFYPVNTDLLIIIREIL